MQRHTKTQRSDNDIAPALLANNAHRLCIIGISYIGALIIINSLAAAAIFGVAKANDWEHEDQDFLSAQIDLKDRYHGELLTVSETAPQTFLNDAQFRLYAGFIVWVTCLIVGLGLEVFVWHYFLQVWSKNREILWGMENLEKFG